MYVCYDNLSMQTKKERFGTWLQAAMTLCRTYRASNLVASGWLTTRANHSWSTSQPVTQCCDEDGGWMIIGSCIWTCMNNLDHKCFTPLPALVSQGFPPVRTTSPLTIHVARETIYQPQESLHQDNCTSVEYSTQGTEYSKVCGRWV